MIPPQNIPSNPGCYLFKDKFGKIIYIGKAKDLKKRVLSYFNRTEESAKTQALVESVDSVDFLVTDNEVEALILENNLIKKFKPKYNINLKDSKRYAYIQITNEEFPRLLIARNREGEGKFYGPFVSAASRDYILEALIKIFKIRTCKKLPKKECLRYSIGLCSAPCINNLSKEEYLGRVKAAELVLKGRIRNLIKILDFKMKENSRILNYEAALEIKNQIEAVKTLEERQKMERDKDYDEDIINYVIIKDKVYLMLFNSKQGILLNKQDFEFEYTDNFLEEFLVQYYSENNIPKKIVIPKEVDESIGEFFKKLKKDRVNIEIPKKGVSKELLDLVKKNLDIALFGDQDKLEDLMDKLKLNELPKVIECFDISHLSGTSMTASMVQFRNAKPDKDSYRRFKIRTVDKIDDYAAMKEVIKRRYSKLKNENLSMPNLIVVDGGKGQLSAALGVLEELNLKLIVISLAKRDEEVFVPGRSSPIVLNKKSKALRLLQQIRNEAHRFAINYNRLLRKKKMLG